MTDLNQKYAIYKVITGFIACQYTLKTSRMHAMMYKCCYLIALFLTKTEVKSLTGNPMSWR